MQNDAGSHDDANLVGPKNPHRIKAGIGGDNLIRNCQDLLLLANRLTGRAAQATGAPERQRQAELIVRVD